MTTIKTLNKIGKALSAERDQNTLLELILTSARGLTGADAGTLYTVDDSQSPAVLRFSQLQNDSLNVSSSGPEAMAKLGFKDIELHRTNDDGIGKTRWVVQHAIATGEAVKIDDVYSVTDFDISGTKAFDKRSGYQSQSMLVVPMLDYENNVIGALQLLNKMHAATGDVTAFNNDDLDITESLASQGAVALTQRRLVDDLHKLFGSFTQVIASAIDSKSPQTGAHCRRVPDITLLLAHAGNRSQLPVVRDFNLSDEELYELELAAWLHDCGKIVTPHHVVEKSTKLETVYDGIELLEARLEIVRRDEVIKGLLSNQTGKETVDIDTFQFLRKLNKGSEFVDDEAIQRLESLRDLHYQTVDGTKQSVIDEHMLTNLSIRKGTLNPEERQIMNDHMLHTLDMLNQLPLPRHLRRIPEYAGGHHEKMNGTGYPQGLTREQMSVPARMMGIADVFEALTAPERSYKAPMALSQALHIMGKMVEDEHLDAELFELFIDEKVYLEYAAMHLDDAQIDHVDVNTLPGYRTVADLGLT